MIMKSFAAILILSLLAIVQAGPAPRVAGGKEAAPGQFPYQVYLTYSGDFVCGGSIINERWILTAAHCLEDLSVKKLSVVVGTNKRDGRHGKLYNVDFTVTPDGYEILPGRIGPVNDIGLIRLTEEITFSSEVQPVRLPENDSENYDDATAILTGWGNVRYAGDSPVNLQYLPLKVLDVKTCNQTWNNFLLEEIEPSKICTTSRVGQGSCHGDSGGPLVVNGVQVGIVSYGWPCATGVPDVFTRVSTQMDWIKVIIRLSEGEEESNELKKNYNISL